MSTQTGRRGFLKTVAAGAGTVAAPAAQPGAQQPAPPQKQQSQAAGFAYPRVFRGRQLAMLAFPLGGVGAGALALGGRGQLCDWELYNRSETGKTPAYAFPSIWAKVGPGKPVARVLESRILPPYEGNDGLGSRNAPGLSRLAGATFTGEYPLARIDFHDAKLPVRVRLEAFSPFVPLDAEDSGLPVAILRYRVSNPSRQTAKVSIAWAIESPVDAEGADKAGSKPTNTHRKTAALEGYFMDNPGLPAAAPRKGSFAVAVRNPGEGRVSGVTGWPQGRWWVSPMMFWDDFTADGELGPETGAHNSVASVCLNREIAPGAEAIYEFVLAWHFPNRTPTRMGWATSKEVGDTVIGNYYCQRFADAWAAAEYASEKLPDLEKKMRRFLTAMRETTLPAAVKEAAMANASTLASTTCFRTADGRFFGWEGHGCCFGNCTHVWNYESTTHYLFPSLARSMRETHLELAERMNGAIPIRVNLPLEHQTFTPAAADGQMGQIIKAYLDWQLSGDTAWLRKWWPAIKKAMEFAWVPGGWDADRDGVCEGVQHNTYDVEFYGPNPLSGIYYLGALRAAEEMARAVDDTGAADEYRALFRKGGEWIDRNLFNGEYYIQQIRAIPKDKIAPGLTAGMGAADPEHPDFQLGDGCLVDQLVGQHVAQFAGLGPLVDAAHIRTTLHSIYKYNYKRSLAEHDAVQRVFALNDEAALVICDYGRGKRPEIPFPYFAEVMTGFEYSAALLMLSYGMVKEGIECITNIRKRYDGERRNAWDEAECGRHYARAMAAWTGIPILSGFRYSGPSQLLRVAPLMSAPSFRSFWSTGTGWGSFTHNTLQGATQLSLAVVYGRLPLRSVELPASAKPGKSSVRLRGQALAHSLKGHTVELADTVNLAEGDELVVTL